MKRIRVKNNFELTDQELEHVRDLLSICLPNNPGVTLSQTMAEKLDKVEVEASLWDKVVNECEKRSLAIGEDAPDFVVVTVSQPDISVFEIEKESSSSETSVFEGVK